MSTDGITPNSSTSHIEDNNLPSKIEKDDSFHQDDQHKKYDERARLEILASTFGVDLEDALRSFSPESHASNQSIIDEADTQKVVIFLREENQENDAEEKQIVTEGAIQDYETPIQWFGEFSEFESLSVSENEDTSVKKNPSVGNGWYKEIGNMPNEEQNSLESTDKIKINKNPDDIPTIPPGNISQETSLKPNHDLVQPVPEVDWQATSVIPAAYKATVKSNGDKVSSTVKPKIKRREKRKTKKTPGCFLRAFLFMFFAGILLLLIIASVGIYQYFRIASSLPNVEELQTRTSQFETTRILDRNGNKLYEIIDPNAGKRTYIPLENISPYLIAATIATEDKEFYNHPGFDPVALMRALWTNYTSGGIVSGASTITQQLARMLLLPDERFEQSYARKAREIILAAEIERRYTKEQILELYLNEIYYGNMAYGIQAASETYFNTTAKNLSLWQAAFLAGLPQTPSVYDVYTNRDATLARNRDVLVLMYEMSLEKNCIYVSTNTANVCVDAVQALQAAETLENHTFVNNNFSIKFPHWVVYIQSILETQYDPQTIYRSGFTVYTTLDPDLQLESERAVREQINTLKANNATNGALIAMDPVTGEILAMVGSADFYDEKISGQVNMATTQTRQPGSSIKPITYLAAFEKDWTPSTLIWDVPSEFPPSGNPDDTRPAYEPVNYDGRFHGPVTVRSALANSYNIPAVKALAYVGIYDDPTTSHPDGFIETAKRLGITSLTRNDYGLSLTLGGGEVSLLEMTGAYSVFANSGRKVSPVAITKIVDHNGNIMYSYEPPSGDQIIRPEHAYLLSSMLSDKQARIPAFGTDPITNLSFQAAVKTGTTNDFRDNWTIGYTPDMVVGVWVGNADYSPMQNTSGLTGAAPIWARVMEFGISHLTNGNPSPFVQPAGIVDRVICSISGAEPSELCPEQRSEIFASDQLPLPKTQDLWVEVSVDTWTGLRASDDCNEFVDEKLAINVTDKAAIKWLTENSAGKSWAEKYGFPDPLFFVPKRACRVDDSRPLIKLHTISDGQIIKISPLQIIGVIDATSNFKEFRIDYGLGPNPDRWRELVDNTRRPVKTTDLIYEWDISELKPGLITLRITVYSQNDTYAIKKYSLILDVPTPTPTTTMTPTETQTEAPTSTPTETSTITPTYTPTSTSTPTQTPTETPTPTSTPE